MDTATIFEYPKVEDEFCLGNITRWKISHPNGEINYDWTTHPRGELIDITVEVEEWLKEKGYTYAMTDEELVEFKLRFL